jgi:uncharacterized protein (DUF1697 family)
MPKYIAFLRAINVGGHTVKMDHLRSLFAALGFANVETFIASGNVIFDSTSKSTQALEKKIEGYLQETLGYPVATFIRSTSELARISEHKPFADSELNAAGHTLYIGFMADRPSGSATANLRSLATKVDDFNVDGREVYWLCRAKFSDSKISGALLAKTLGLPATLRNATTVKKLAAKYPHRK